MVFTFIAHDSINLNAQCAEVDIKTAVAWCWYRELRLSVHVGVELVGRLIVVRPLVS